MGRKRSRPAPRKRETHRVGRRIRVREVRVIDADGSQLGILPTQDAMQRAEEQSLQLVEVNPKTSPPVCKIMDYGKFKYETAKRERETKKNKKSQELKEVKFRPKTHDHDFDFKVKHARRFLEDGNKVRLLVQFRGREITHPETGRDVLNRVVKALADLATVIQIPSMEGNRMNMILAPKPRRDGGGGGNKPKPPARKPDSGGASKADSDDEPETDETDTKDAPESEQSESKPAAQESGESKDTAAESRA
ncbi:translation initiation factor IF-3 [Pseudenhygromyxa sp. WMMC2535]|uniref:translation initiation factor IF-3 n=1 Tax=Pseudenhygromyxa sp. WMMC2535 TaxID=2712867 RepID=UPI0015563C96|nr:translation initiation factor IF-3 [Pseudenhygromyxa sp. WMMC2535]